MNPNNTFNPSELPSLQKRLGGKLRLPKQQKEQPKKSTRGRKPKQVTNHVYWYFRSLEKPKAQHMASEIENVISGIARLDHYREQGERNIPLSTSKLTYLLTFRSLDSDTIADVLNVTKRQGQIYLRAIELILGFIDDAILSVLEREKQIAIKKYDSDNEVELYLESYFILKYGMESVDMDYDDSLESVYRPNIGFILDIHSPTN